MSYSVTNVLVEPLSYSTNKKFLFFFEKNNKIQNNINDKQSNLQDTNNKLQN